MEAIKKLCDGVKNNSEMSQEEKDQALELLKKLANLLALY
jgi:hypothetical protein